MKDMQKCFYCHKKAETLIPLTDRIGKETETVEVCGEDCEAKTRAFFRYFNRTLPVFWGGIALAVVILLASLIFHPQAVFVALGIGVLGLTVLLFPFATPQTVSGLGLKKTRRLIRVLGVICLLLSVLWWLL